MTNKEYHKKYYQENKEKIKEYQKNKDTLKKIVRNITKRIKLNLTILSRNMHKFDVIDVKIKQNG